MTTAMSPGSLAPIKFTLSCHISFMGKFCFRFIKRQTIFAIFYFFFFSFLAKTPFDPPTPHPFPFEQFERIQNLCYMRRNGAFWQKDSAQGEGLWRGGKVGGCLGGNKAQRNCCKPKRKFKRESLELEPLPASCSLPSVRIPWGHQWSYSDFGAKEVHLS